MAGVPEKVRYYLEQSVPQLREFESKGIFTAEEIRGLVRKRTDFEHLVLSPGSKPEDWLSYAAWEKSLEKLRAKRCRRLQIHTSSAHAGQGRVFGILERAVGRHPGSVELWKEYLNFARDVKATKRWRKVMSRALRMHPSKPEMWVIAGKRSASNGDMQAARGFFMRGTRFCTRDAALWLEYARCEMEWLERMEARKAKKGGVEKAIREQAETGDDDQIIFADEDSDEDVDENGQLVLPDPDAKGKKLVFDEDAVHKMKDNPALDGAIPLAIFDIAKKQQFFNVTVAEQFFNLLAEFPKISSQARMLQHVLDSMNELYTNTPATCACYIRQPLVGIDFNSAASIKPLREALTRIKTSLDTTTHKAELARKITSWMEPILSSEDLDSGIRSILEYTLQSLPSS